MKRLVYKPLRYYIPQLADYKDSKINGAVADTICFQLVETGEWDSNKKSTVCQVDKMTIFRKFQKNRKKRPFSPEFNLENGRG